MCALVLHSLAGEVEINRRVASGTIQVRYLLTLGFAI